MAHDQPTNEQHSDEPQTPEQEQEQEQHPPPAPTDDVDGLKDKKPDELTADELRLMADTMPGEGPGD